MNEITMSADEKIKAIGQLTINLEDDFVQLGQLLGDVKKSKLFKFKGYKTLKEFVENELNLTGSFASKLIGTYALFIERLEIDEGLVKKIGLDKLNIIKSVVNKLDYKDAIEWVDRARDQSATELREEVREVKAKDVSKTLKEVFVDQYIEKMVTFFNCTKKDLDFKLALYFQDKPLEDVNAQVLLAKRRFEED